MKFQANVPFKLTKMFYEKLGEQPKDKSVLVIRDLFTAMHASIDNTVTFVTDDKEAYELFNKNVVSNDEFGNNDTAIFVDTEINKKAWNDFIKELSNMPKFDVAIMNPPYDRNLHLKILEAVIPIANKVVNISPVLWMKRRGSAEIKRFGDTVGKHIISLEEICDGNNIFETCSYFKLGIYVLDNNIHDFDYENYWKTGYDDMELCILDKLTKCDTLNNKPKATDVRYGTNVLISGIAGGRGDKPILKYQGIVIDGKTHDTNEDFIDAYNAEPKHKAWQKTSYVTYAVSFDTFNEAKNFYNSYNTKFMSWVCNKTCQQQHIKLIYLPYMQDYTQPWDDKRFCEYFNITGYISDTEAEPGSEWEIILNTMK